MNLFGVAFIKPWMIDRADDPYEMDISRARDLLGWEPRHRLLNTLPTIVARLKEDPVSRYKESDLDLPANLAKQQMPKRIKRCPFLT